MKKTTILFAEKIYNLIKASFNGAITSFLNSSLVKKFSIKHPNAYAFFIDRFSLDKFTGLPFTFLTFSFIANLLLLDEIIDAFVENPLIVTIDQSFASLMYSFRVDWIAKAFYYFTLLGSFWGVVIIAFFSTLLFVFYKSKTYILPVWIALLGTQFTVQMSKIYFHRTRPLIFAYYPEISYSFPSGHATVSVAFYGVLFYAIIRSRTSNASKFRWIISGIIFIGLLGFSRLYLCVHYLSDVMAGYSLGLLWMLLAISMREWMIHKKATSISKTK